MMSSSDPTVLWRMSRGRSTAHATIFPGDTQTTVTWFFDGVMDRAENYDTIGPGPGARGPHPRRPAEGRLEGTRSGTG